MSMRLTRWAYESLVAEDIAWLKTMPRTLERDHILMILGEAVRYEYDSDYAQGVADERARVVAFLRAADSECLVWFAAQRIEQGWHERFERVPNLDNGGE